DPHEPVFSAAAEIDPSHDRPRLDVFASTGERHEDNGGDWADLDRFTAKALELAAEGLSVAEPPQELPLP
ncbi:MAG TPA: hypothetical protein VFA26_04170, partial [Gemmataceae bacterium]|nr:hypothetical protein [Gemmataceae bacterium]